MILYALTSGFLDDIPVEDIFVLKYHYIHGLIITVKIYLKQFAQQVNLPADEDMEDALIHLKEHLQKVNNDK